MADEPTPSQNSPEPAPEASDAPADPAPAAAAPADDAAPQDTALGSAGDDPAPKDGDKPDAPVIPEAYELAAPEGMEINPTDIETATPIFKELGLSNEQANKLMPVAGQFAQRLVENINAKAMEQVAATRKGWLDTAKADPEVGGAKWDQSLATAAKALDTLGFPKGSEFRKLLDESGLGNHPDMIRFAARVGQKVGEDSTFVRADAGTPSKKSDAEIFYGNQGNK